MFLMMPFQIRPPCSAFSKAFLRDLCGKDLKPLSTPRTPQGAKIFAATPTTTGSRSVSHANLIILSRATFPVLIFQAWILSVV
jgi:hypothetical protein